ncbi:MAG: hypothetical protein H6R13_3020 [Proteobacteria bacterium]|nr:hypothetical protein [Pseudomonadota bacterium]
MGEKYTVSKWRYWCIIRNKWLVTQYKTTAESIAKEHPEATPVRGTEEVRETVDDLYANSTSSFLRNWEPPK